ncbi:unnamed protein product [Didymodactylos carnosus]|uniref:Uncharacterized protein n=1 Tax=Didymodactylos carnosus TaxID=1234261 RepID=A0A816BGK4_9BILA|nr:unnamed protein product [Didymodactylos carnosus]CAF4490857.1 unnamed protein product [Didymodactylos carnosus]
MDEELLPTINQLLSTDIVTIQNYDYDNTNRFDDVINIDASPNQQIAPMLPSIEIIAQPLPIYRARYLSEHKNTPRYVQADKNNRFQLKHPTIRVKQITLPEKQ